jgi:hypothetical protein
MGKAETSVTADKELEIGNGSESHCSILQAFGDIVGYHHYTTTNDTGLLPHIENQSIRGS